jgi:glycine cleavage system H protein
MLNPVDRRYSEARAWARAVGDCPVIVGIAHDAQHLPGGQVLGAFGPGRKLGVGDQCGVVESVKSASDSHAPISGPATSVDRDFETGASPTCTVCF